MTPMNTVRSFPALMGVGLLLALAGCATPMTHHPTVVSDLGVASRTSDMTASLVRPGTVGFRRIAFATWIGGRGSFIDRDDPRTATVPKGTEDATIYAYVLDHPVFGRVWIDAGVSADLERRLNPIMRQGVRELNLRIDRTAAQFLAGQTSPRAVFLTHLHFDHIGGLIDLPPTTPVYLGAGDAEDRSRINSLLGHPADGILTGFGPLREWEFHPDPNGRFIGILDIFGDGSVWAIRVPGHTPGSTAYLINATDGPKLVVGDAVSTRLGWEQGMPQPVPPAAKSAAEASAEALRRFAADHPEVEVFLGHQSRTGQAEEG